MRKPRILPLVISVVDDVWTQFLGIPILATRQFAWRSHAFVAGCAYIDGGWQGNVIVACDSRSSIELSAAMLEKPAIQISRQDINDCVSEIINLVAGNIKSLWFANHSLSPPVLFATGESGFGNHGRVVCRPGFATGLGQFGIAIAERTMPRMRTRRLYRNNWRHLKA